MKLMDLVENLLVLVLGSFLLLISKLTVIGLRGLIVREN